MKLELSCPFSSPSQPKSVKIKKSSVGGGMTNRRTWQRRRDKDGVPSVQTQMGICTYGGGCVIRIGQRKALNWDAVATEAPTFPRAEF